MAIDEDNQRVLREFRRVLVSGGQLLIETLHHDGFLRSVTIAPPAVDVRRAESVTTS